ncbi:hypothetical protein IB69_021025 [Xanthomonas citri]|nr:hypothetical protein IB69_021025 [Xanthomonas citri]
MVWLKNQIGQCIQERTKAERTDTSEMRRFLGYIHCNTFIKRLVHDAKKIKVVGVQRSGRKLFQDVVSVPAGCQRRTNRVELGLAGWALPDQSLAMQRACDYPLDVKHSKMRKVMPYALGTDRNSIEIKMCVQHQ